MLEHTNVTREWKSRRRDQSFDGLHALGAKARHDKDISRAVVVASRKVEAVADADHQGLTIVGTAGVGYAPTHWSMGQLCGLAGAPHAYLAKLPSELAADCVNVGFKVLREVSDVGLFLQKNDGPGGPGVLAAATGPNYGRIFNADIADVMVDRFGDGKTGQWQSPGGNALFCSDRDMFAFMIDDTNRITLPNRRNGKSGTLSRGFYVKNSEVGAAKLTIQAFLFDWLCLNRTVFGTEEVVSIDIRHTKSAPVRFAEEVIPFIRELSSTSAGPLEAKLKAAQRQRVDALDDFLLKRSFNRSQISGFRNAFEAEEGQPLETETHRASLWDINTAITAYAKRLDYQDDRVDMERSAGRVLDLVRI